MLRGGRARWEERPIALSLVLVVDDRRGADVWASAARYLACARERIPPEAVFALGGPEFENLAITPIGGGRLVGGGGGAAARARPRRAEVDAHGGSAGDEAGGGEGGRDRLLPSPGGQGIGTATVHHLPVLARERGYRRISLENGAAEAFRPARRLYEPCGFVRFDDRPDSDGSVIMTRTRDDRDDPQSVAVGRPARPDPREIALECVRLRPSPFNISCTPGLAARPRWCCTIVRPSPGPAETRALGATHHLSNGVS